jgi:hypothetical protein
LFCFPDIKHHSHEKANPVLKGDLKFSPIVYRNYLSLIKISEIYGPNRSIKGKKIEKSSSNGPIFGSNKENCANVATNKSLKYHNITKGLKKSMEKPREKPNKPVSQIKSSHQKPKKSIPIPNTKPKDRLNPIHQKKIAEVTSRMQNYAKIYAERKEMLIKKHSTEELRTLRSKADPCPVKEGLVQVAKPFQRLTLVQRHAHGKTVGTKAKVRFDCIFLKQCQN